MSEPRDEYISINGIPDIVPVAERVIERALVLSLVVFPHQTLSAILETRIEPSLDPQVTLFWGKVRPRTDKILDMDESEAQSLVYSFVPRSLFWKWDTAYKILGRPTAPKVLLTDLIAVRSLRRSLIYVQDHKLIDRVFDGWVEL